MIDISSSSHAATHPACRTDLISLPDDLRERVRRKVMSVEQARAWARLRAAFNGDTEALQTTLLTAYGVQ